MFLLFVLLPAGSCGTGTSSSIFHMSAGTRWYSTADSLLYSSWYWHSAGHFILLLVLFSARTAHCNQATSHANNALDHSLSVNINVWFKGNVHFLNLSYYKSFNKYQSGGWKGPDFSEDLRTLVFPSLGITTKTRLPPLPAAPMLRRSWRPRLPGSNALSPVIV
jgi:hypothetical protein